LKFNPFPFAAKQSRIMHITQYTQHTPQHNQCRAQSAADIPKDKEIEFAFWARS
jgi:hypothetical protein